MSADYHRAIDLISNLTKVRETNRSPVHLHTAADNASRGCGAGSAGVAEPDQSGLRIQISRGYGSGSARVAYPDQLWLQIRISCGC